MQIRVHLECAAGMETEGLLVLPGQPGRTEGVAFTRRKIVSHTIPWLSLLRGCAPSSEEKAWPVELLKRGLVPYFHLRD